MGQRADDLKMLRALIRCDALDDEAKDAFSSMWDRLDGGRVQLLSHKQRAWAEKLYYKHHLDRDEGSTNMVSSGQIKVTAAERKSLQTFLDSLGPRPLKPPGRK